MSRSSGALALSLLILSGIAASTAVTACGAFDAGSDPDPVAGAADATVDAPASGPDAGLDADGATPSARCNGPFRAPRPVPSDVGFFKSLRSVRGASNGLFLVSWDTSPDDNMGTATLTPGGLVLGTAASNPFRTLNTPADETAPTGPSTLGFILFGSDRPASTDADAAASPLQLWLSSGADGFASAVQVPVDNLAAGAAVRNPYLVDTRLYFDSGNQLRSGLLTTGPDQVVGVAAVPGVEGGTHPVASKDAREIFYQVGAGVRMQTRADVTQPFDATVTILGAPNDYPTWISDDACQLFLVHPGVGQKDLLIFDRER